MAGNAHIVRRRRRRSIRSADTRVVLRAAPAETDARVANRVALHLVDRHLGGVSVDELDEAATLARRDLDVSDLTKTLEEASKLVLRDISGEATHEDGGVVGIRELIHLCRRVEVEPRLELAWGAVLHLLLLRKSAAHHLLMLWLSISAAMGTAGKGLVECTREATHQCSPVLRCGSRNSHWSIAAIDSLHFDEGPLLVRLIGEAHEPIAPALARHSIGHDLSRLAGWETRLEERDQHVFIDLGTEITDEDGVLWATIIAEGQC
jgi:hypothetical protein